MTFRKCFEFVVAATVSVSASAVHAQSKRATGDMDTGTTITSLTNLHRPSSASQPFGAIDASANYSATLDVLLAADSASAETSNESQSGTASGHSGSKGSIPASPNLLQGRNLQFVTGTHSVSNVSPAHTPGPQSLQPGYPKSRLSLSPQSVHSASPQFQLAPAAGTPSQTGSVPIASNASKITGLQPAGDVHLHQSVMGAPATSSRSHLSTLGDLALSTGSRRTVSADADSVNVDAPTNESSVTATDKQEPKGFFEGVEDPFGDQFRNSFEGTKKRFGMERTCGDACSIKKSSHKSEDVAPETSESARSVEPAVRSGLRPFGNLPHSRLELTVGRLSNEDSGSRSLDRGRLKDMETIKRGSADSASRKESSN
jgi:hypothetical protein